MRNSKTNIFEILDSVTGEVVSLGHGRVFGLSSGISSLLNHPNPLIRLEVSKSRFAYKLIDRVSRDHLDERFHQLFTNYKNEGISLIGQKIKKMEILSRICDWTNSELDNQSATQSTREPSYYNLYELERLVESLEEPVIVKGDFQNWQLGNLQKHFEVLLVMKGILLGEYDVMTHDADNNFNFEIKVRFCPAFSSQLGRIDMRTLGKMTKYSRCINLDYLCRYFNKLLEITGCSSRISIPVLQYMYLHEYYKKAGTRNMEFWKSRGFSSSEEVTDCIRAFSDKHIANIRSVKKRNKLAPPMSFEEKLAIIRS